MKNQINVTPLRIAVIGIAATAAFLAVLVGATFLRARAAQNLENDMQVIEENFSQRMEADLERIAELEEELAEFETELESLQDAFPEVSEPFDIYQQGQALAVQNQVTLLSISRLGSELSDTPQGVVQSTNYALQLEGPAQSCIAYIQSLEDAGLGSVNPEEIQISPPGSSCELNARVFSLPVNPE